MGFKFLKILRTQKEQKFLKGERYKNIFGGGGYRGGGGSAGREEGGRGELSCLLCVCYLSCPVECVCYVPIP